MNIPEMGRPVGGVLKSRITDMTLVGLQAEMTVHMIPETESYCESFGAACE